MPLATEGVLAFTTVWGVDFSGARQAGRSLWVARLAPWRRRHRLTSLVRAGRECGSPDRQPSLAWLVAQVAASDAALWGLDFPFGLPVEVLPPGATWRDQLALVAGWGDGAYALGLECLARARRLGGPGHIRRLTDQEARTPFDCYHYRIIYQTFFGMRDVLGPLADLAGTAVLPFQYRRLPRARRVLVEACPSSTLKRLRLPHRNYKQPAGGPLTPLRRRTRHAILAGLAPFVDLSATHRRVIMRDGGADALDAVLAALGAVQAWRLADHAAIARHPRYPREGRLFA